MSRSIVSCPQQRSLNLRSIKGEVWTTVERNVVVILCWDVSGNQFGIAGIWYAARGAVLCFPEIRAIRKLRLSVRAHRKLTVLARLGKRDMFQKDPLDGFSRNVVILCPHVALPRRSLLPLGLSVLLCF